MCACRQPLSHFFKIFSNILKHFSFSAGCRPTFSLFPMLFTLLALFSCFILYFAVFPQVIHSFGVGMAPKTLNLAFFDSGSTTEPGWHQRGRWVMWATKLGGSGQQPAHQISKKFQEIYCKLASQGCHTW